MLELHKTAQFKKDLKLVVKQGLPVNLLDEVIITLREQKPLPAKYEDHPLKGRYTGFRECHILPDWLLIYTADSEKLTLTASRTGSHSDLF